VATITHYVSQGFQAGQPVALKIRKRRWRTVGHGTVEAVSGFEIEIAGCIKLRRYKGDLQVDVALLDQDEAAMEGPCRLRVNSQSDDNAWYRTHEGGLTISAVFDGTEVQVRLSRSEHDNMTECKVSGPLDLTAYIEMVANSD
jgi:hypothetical protein